MLSDLSVGERSGRVIVRSGKGNEARTVPLNASARIALSTWLCSPNRTLSIALLGLSIPANELPPI